MTGLCPGTGMCCPSGYYTTGSATGVLTTATLRGGIDQSITSDPVANHCKTSTSACYSSKENYCGDKNNLWTEHKSSAACPSGQKCCETANIIKSDKNKFCVKTSGKDFKTKWEDQVGPAYAKYPDGRAVYDQSQGVVYGDGTNKKILWDYCATEKGYASYNLMPTLWPHPKKFTNALITHTCLSGSKQAVPKMITCTSGCVEKNGVPTCVNPYNEKQIADCPRTGEPSPALPCKCLTGYLPLSGVSYKGLPMHAKASCCTTGPCHE